MSVRSKFDEELKFLNDDIIKMACMIEKAINDCIKCIEKRDLELAKEVIESDKAINDMEKQIETRCLKLLLRQQPVAKDLRLISTTLKMITDLERIGDHAADIAYIALDEGAQSLKFIRLEIKEMIHLALEMLANSISCFINDNKKLARATIKNDDELDKLFYEVRDDIIKKIKNEEIEPDTGINTIMICKYIEKIGDHATNIAEWVIFYLTGEHKDTKII